MNKSEVKTMKKRWVVLSLAVLMGLSFTGMHSSKVQASSWGAKVLYTTPKTTRGTWYYKDHGKIKKWVITAHTSCGKKLYKILPAKEYDKMSTKLIRADEKNHYRVSKQVSSKWLQAKSIKKHGLTGFNQDGWLAGAGNGTYLLPTKKTRNGKKVSALRIGYGADNWKLTFAYKDKKLVK